jgi:hypothetical protein
MADNTSGTSSSAQPTETEAAAPAPRPEAAPRHRFLALRQEIDRLFDDFFSGFSLTASGRRGGGLEVDPWRRFQGAFGMGFPAVDLALLAGALQPVALELRQVLHGFRCVERGPVSG